jgi:6-phospho-3-hexuloisomerase
MNDTVDQILNANNIVVAGAGRMGLMCKAFAMRLSHLGLMGYFLGDSNTPRIGKGDLLIVASSSGETQTIYDLVVIAKKAKAAVLLITMNPVSRMGKKADYIVEMPDIKSKYPMKTGAEHWLMMYFDKLVLKLMKKLDETSESMWERHTNLE